MSTTAKLAMSGLSGMLAAFFFGQRLATDVELGNWPALGLIAVAVCALVFVRQLLALHLTLKQINRRHGAVRSSDGRLMVP